MKRPTRVATSTAARKEAAARLRRASAEGPPDVEATVPQAQEGQRSRQCHARDRPSARLRQGDGERRRATRDAARRVPQKPPRDRYRSSCRSAQRSRVEEARARGTRAEVACRGARSRGHTRDGDAAVASWTGRNEQRPPREALPRVKTRRWRAAARWRERLAQAGATREVAAGVRGSAQSGVLARSSTAGDATEGGLTRDGEEKEEEVREARRVARRERERRATRRERARRERRESERVR